MDLSIIFINDVHGYIDAHPEIFYEGEEEIIKSVGGYARLAGFVDEVRKKEENVLVFDGGDTFHGTLPVVESKGENILSILNEFGFNAMVGHWDFAYGPDHFKMLASKLNYPVVAINVYDEYGNLFFRPYSLINIVDVKVAVIGICATIVDRVMPKKFSEGIKMTDGAKELPDYVKKVREEGADLIILLSHNGFPQDYDLISKTDGVDICLSAHTHNRLYEAVKVNDCVIVQCGCHGSFAGKINLKIEDKIVHDIKYALHVMDEKYPKNEKINESLREILFPYQHLFEETVGKTPLTLHRYNTLNSKMDNLLLASIKYVTNTIISFSNGWRYGAPIPAGTISKMDLYNIIPHNPKVSTVMLKGNEIKTLLENNLEATFSPDPMHQMGGYVKRCMGLTAYIKIENPKGFRIQELYIDGKPYDKTKTYTVSFVTEQGVPLNIGEDRKETDIDAVKAMEIFLKEKELTKEIINNKSFITY